MASSWTRCFQVLPQLRELRLDKVPLGALSALTDVLRDISYRRLKRVELMIDIDGRKLPASFVQALADATHPLAQSLETVGFREKSRALVLLTDDLVTILSNNKRLAKLVIEVHGIHDTRPRDEQLLDQLRDAVMRHDGDFFEEVHGQWMHEKLAFLSGVWEMTAPTPAQKNLIVRSSR